MHPPTKEKVHTPQHYQVLGCFLIPLFNYLLPGGVQKGVHFFGGIVSLVSILTLRWNLVRVAIFRTKSWWSPSWVLLPRRKAVVYRRIPPGANESSLRMAMQVWHSASSWVTIRTSKQRNQITCRKRKVAHQHGGIDPLQWEIPGRRTPPEAVYNRLPAKDTQEQ